LPRESVGVGMVKVVGVVGGAGGDGSRTDGS
jgi:hypothetical protein